MRISYSAYATYKQCPLQYKYSYVDRLPKKESHHLFFGSLVHEALHYMLKDIKLRTLDDIHKFYHSKWDDRLFVEAKLKPEEWKQKGLNLINAFHGKYDPNAQEILVTEDYFAIPLEGGHVLSGVIDRLDKIKDASGQNTLEIIDYKTGKLESQSHIHDNIQLTFYYHAIRSRFPDMKDIRLTLYFLEPQVRRSTFRDEGHVARMKEAVYETIAQIERQKFEPKINNLCPWCDYKEICPAYAKEQPTRRWPAPDIKWQEVLLGAMKGKGRSSEGINVKAEQSAHPAPKKRGQSNDLQGSLF